MICLSDEYETLSTKIAFKVSIQAYCVQNVAHVGISTVKIVTNPGTNHHFWIEPTSNGLYNGALLYGMGSKNKKVKTDIQVTKTIMKFFFKFQ